jgi:potassium efflux system protein
VHLLAAPLSAASPATSAGGRAATAAATTQASRPADDVSAEMIQTALAALDQDKTLDPNVKAAATGLYNQAMDQIKAAQECAAKAAKFAAERAEAPARLEEVQALLAQPVQVRTQMPPEASTAELEQALREATSQLAPARRGLAELEAEPARRNDRRAEIPKQMVATSAQREETDKALAAPAEAGEATVITDARKTLLRARRLALRQQMSAYRRESENYESTGELLMARRDLAAREVASLQKASDAIRELISQRKKSDVEKAAQEAAQELAGAASAHPLVLRVAQENKDLAQLRTGSEGVTARLDQVQRQVRKMQADRDSVNREFANAQDRVRVLGMNNATGRLLRKLRSELPAIPSLRQQIAATREEIPNVQLQALELGDRREALAAIDDVIAGMIAAQRPPLAEHERHAVESALRALLTKQKTYLDDLIGDCNRLSSQLLLLNEAGSYLVTKVEEFLNYIDERVLWTRNSPPMYRMDCRALAAAAGWLVAPANWEDLWSLTSRPVTVVFLVTMLAVLTLWRRSLRAKLANLGQAILPGVEGLGATFRAMLATLIAVALIPLLIWMISTVIASADGSDFSRAIVGGLRALALGCLTVSVLVDLCRPGGLAESYFGWQASVTGLLRRRLIQLAWIVVPLVTVVAIMECQALDGRKDTLGRLAFVAAMVAVTVFCAGVLRSSQPGMHAMRERFSKGPLGRLSPGRPLHLLSVAAPLALAVAAFSGYYYGAIELAWRLVCTVWLVVGALIAWTLLQRWILLARRNVAVSSILSSMAGRRSKVTTRGGEGPTSPTPDAVDVESKLDSLHEQSHRLMGYGTIAIFLIALYFTWEPVLPALGRLTRITLWTHSGLVTSQQAGSSGVAAGNVQGQVPVTLGDLCLAIVVLLLSLGLARGVPGMLQLILLKRMRFESGDYYAMAAVIRYAVTVVGVIVAFGLVGIGWNSVQWLAAAFTVGLAFGLQEIFANFVSGIIIFFERPVRVSDTVTVNETTGVVSRIQIRATTLVDAENREVVIPNKTFITGKVVNWTLSNTVLRQTIPIAITYDSDIQQAQTLMVKIARENRLVLKNPPPEALVVGLSRGKARLELLVHTSNFADLEKVKDELLVTVKQGLSSAGMKLL